jgi:hypothetical protein
MTEGHLLHCTALVGATHITRVEHSVKRSREREEKQKEGT